MATNLLPPATSTPAVRGAAPGRPAPRASIWHAPLVPLALALTAGIVLDRHAPVPFWVSLLALGVFLIAAAATIAARQTGLALVYLCCGVAAAGAAYYHGRRELVADDDIVYQATDEPWPVQLRGVLDTEPVYSRAQADPLRSFTGGGSTRAVLRVTQRRRGDGLVQVSGLVQLTVGEELKGLHVGDRVEVAGMLTAPPGRANPGGFDYADFLQDQQVRALLTVRRAAAVKLLETGTPWSVPRALALVRAWGRQELEKALPEKQAGLAVALLLGDGSALSREDWNRYQRSGVLHVLAISGQHLVVLAGFLWVGLRACRLRQRHGALVVALFLLTYALLTGGRPPAMRSAVMACAFCGSLILRKPLLSANCFALAWIAVAVLDPSDVFNAGCQLSFLAVAVLYWVTRSWEKKDADPLEELIEESRPAWQRRLLWLWRQLWVSYAVTIVVWLAVTPLVAAQFHMVQFIGVPLGPPAVLLTSIALVAGFCLLLLAPILAPLAQPFAWLVSGSLAACDALIDLGVSWRPGSWYVGDVPVWWSAAFYAGLLASMTLLPLRQRWPWGLLAGVGWLALGLAVALVRPGSGEFRCTFLAVGHGGCAVLETPDGRTFLYDAGALAGPDVTRRHIVPYLWHRGVRRVDEVFLSHADLDHYNGIPALLECFQVGQVTCTPTFQHRGNRAVAFVLRALRSHAVPVRVVRAGDRLSAGGIVFDVLHPPAASPEGNENSRSLVLLVRHGDHSILLTGDLEGLGLERVLTLAPPRVDVLQAPHHGSSKANTPELARWASPAIVVCPQKRPRAGPRPRDPYRAVGSRVLGTWPHGAITVRSGSAGLTVETFVSGLKWLIRR